MHEQLYRSLLRIRRVEEEIARIYPSDRIKSPIHLSIGQESVSVGVCSALLPQDIVFGTYRGHALYLARGGSMAEMMAELFGKATGCTRGKGGSMHLIAPECGLMGTSAIVGTTIANAVGFAYALRYRRSNALVVSFFGDGATEEGVFAESLNLAVLKRLPILFVCENNQYAIHTHQSRRQGRPVICDRASGLGVPAETLDGNDVVSLRARTQQATTQIRAGGGPQLLEVMTCRWHEHVGPGQDFHLGYRDRSEMQAWIESDPIRRLAEQINPLARQQIDREIEEEIVAALAFAEVSPFPGPEELYSDVFKEETDACHNPGANSPAGTQSACLQPG